MGDTEQCERRETFGCRAVVCWIGRVKTGWFQWIYPARMADGGRSDVFDVGLFRFILLQDRAQLISGRWQRVSDRFILFHVIHRPAPGVISAAT